MLFLLYATYCWFMSAIVCRECTGSELLKSLKSKFCITLSSAQRDPHATDNLFSPLTPRRCTSFPGFLKLHMKKRVEPLSRAMHCHHVWNICCIITVIYLSNNQVKQLFICVISLMGLKPLLILAWLLKTYLNLAHCSCIYWASLAHPKYFDHDLVLTGIWVPSPP